MSKLRCVAVLALSAVAAWGGAARPADWPQWRGPQRDGRSTETGLLKSFPAGGPKLLWTFDKAGTGFSSPAVVGDRLYSVGDDGSQEFVFALDAATGKQLWRQPFGATFEVDHGGGPRGTPTVDGDALYVLGPLGDLACLATADGKVRWKVNLVRDLHGELMSHWGYSESPLVDGDQVVCTPGGEEGTLAALDKKTGQVRWRSTGLSAKATYSSIVISNAAGVRHYVQLTKDGPAGFSPKDGKVLWQEAVSQFEVASIPTPVVSGDYVYVTSSYGAGCGLVKLSADGRGGLKSEVVYANRRVIDNHVGGVILAGQHVFGSSGIANNVRSLPFVCQDFRTGKVAWQHTLEPSAPVYADGHLYCYGQNTGTIVCVEATPKGYVEKGRFTIPKQSADRDPSARIWTPPVIANGKLYLRDQELLFCFDLRVK